MPLTAILWAEWGIEWIVMITAVVLHTKEKGKILKQVDELVIRHFGTHDMQIFAILDEGLNGNISLLLYLSIATSLVISFLIAIENGLIH